MLEFELSSDVNQDLTKLIKRLRKTKIGRLEIVLPKKTIKMLKFSRILSTLYKLLDAEVYFEVLLKNVPFCVLTEASRDHVIWTTNHKGEKLTKCGMCKYANRCVGFSRGYFRKFGTLEVRPIKDLPCEVMIEVESRCNFNCLFCFNKISFAKEGRNIKPFSTAYLKKIISNISRAGIASVRFTGGEPLLRKDIFELMKYAKQQGLEVRLNTNGSLIDEKVSKKLAGLVDNILLPIESFQADKERMITGKIDSLRQKIRAIKLLKNEKIPVVRVGTVALKENIRNLEKFADFIFKLPIDDWELYRPISSSKELSSITNKDVELLLKKIKKIRGKTGRMISIANAIPFCSVKDLNQINGVSLGALYDDGHNRLVIDPRDFVKPHYFFDKNIGRPLDVLKAWNNPFMKQMRNLKYLPLECSECIFKYKCRGGSRHEAMSAFGNYRALDPLAKPAFIGV